MFKIVRFNNWWSIIIPQILGWIYFCEITASHPFLMEDSRRVGLFFLGVIAIAAFGYLFNDYCDVDSDRISGKKNLLENFNRATRAGIVLIPLVIGITAWTCVHAGAITKTLYALQIIALVIYSAPPIRLKERSWLGIAADAFYGHINPAFFTLGTFVCWDFTFGQSVLFITVLIIATTLKGIRNILLHQLDDRKKDRFAGIQTFVVKNGGLFSLYLVNNLLLFEIISTVILSLVISFFFPPFFSCLLFFSIVTYLKFSGWKLADVPQRQLKFKFLYFLNDYYEGWVPVFFLILLSVKQPVFLFLLLLHLFLFPPFIIKLWKDLKTIKQNFKTEDEY